MACNKKSTCTDAMHGFISAIQSMGFTVSGRGKFRPLNLPMEAVLCYFCPVCPNEFEKYALHRSLETLNQHITRRHGREAQVISGENVRRLLATQTGQNGSFVTSQLEIVHQDFRCRSLHEQRSMILEQSLGEDEGKTSLNDMRLLFPALKDKSQLKLCIDMLLEGETLGKKPWSDFLRHSMALDEKGCASSRAWVPVHCKTTVEHYSSTLASFAFVCSRVDPYAYPASMSMPDLFLKVLCETESGITHQFMARKFLNFSYICMGRGTRSRQPTFYI